MTAAINMAATIEYLLCELLELSGNQVKDNHPAKPTIRPTDINFAIQNDNCFPVLLQNVIIPGSSKVEYIHHALLPKPDNLRRSLHRKQRSLQKKQKIRKNK